MQQVENLGQLETKRHEWVVATRLMKFTLGRTFVQLTLEYLRTYRRTVKILRPSQDF